MKRATRHVLLGPAAIVLSALCLVSCVAGGSLHKAAAEGDASRIDQCMKRGMAVNARDDDGNTPLHYAYCHNRTETIERLLAYGADPNIRNTAGDTPADMREIGIAEDLVRRCAHLLDQDGSWRDLAQARQCYDALACTDGTIVTKVLIRQIVDNGNRLRVLMLAVKLGIPGSESQLDDVLQTYGDEHMAEDYLNCGSPRLHDAGQRWAQTHGYTVYTGSGSHRVVWGRF